MNSKQSEIIAIVSRKGRVSVTELAQTLGTSEVTIRKELGQLSDAGILRREQGYASLKDPSDINYRIAINYAVKQRIAKAAAEHVTNGETIMVEAGSTCALFAQELVASGKLVTLITNSSYLAHFVKEKGNVNIILLGGEFQNASQAMVGPLTKHCAKQFRVGKIFVGTDGFSHELGFTGDNLTRSETVHAMTQRADQTFMLTESEKFKRPGTVSFLQTDEVHHIITDNELDPTIRTYFEKNKIQITTI